MAIYHLYQVLKTDVSWFIGSDKIPENFVGLLSPRTNED